MRVIHFDNGDMTVHDIRGVIEGAKISAYYSADGLKDAEYIKGDTARAVNRNWRNVRDELEWVGRAARRMETTRQ